VRALRRTLRSAGTDVIVVGGSMRAQTYAHVATLGLRHRPILVQYMTEQDSARRWVTSRLLRRFGAVVTVGSNAARAYQAALPGQDVVTVNNFLLAGEIRVAPSGRAHSRIGPP